jgi:hypothetical protein
MKALSSITATLAVLLFAPVAIGQSYFQPGFGAVGPYANQRQMMPAAMSGPMMTAFFQDGAVPAPADPGGSPAAVPSAGAASEGVVTGDPGLYFPSDGGFLQSGEVMSSPDLSLPPFQDSTTWNAFSPPQIGDPFLDPNAGQVQPYSPYPSTVPAQGAFDYGANPASPYRYGWQNRIDVSWLPGGEAQGAGTTGDQDIFGVDYELTYGAPVVPGWVFNWTNQFAYRNWSGPSGVAAPSDLFRFGLDFEFETAGQGPVNLSLGVTPSLNTDFNVDFSDGFQLDGRGILLFQLDQYWTLGLGAQYWDRVNDYVIPWAGLIYRDDYWEWQLMYPEARVSLFLGNEAYWAKWLYVRAEYHVEAYGFEEIAGAVDEVEVSDYRILGGFKMDAGLYNWFIEGGWVFNRDVEYASGPEYELSNGFIGQVGLRY